MTTTSFLHIENTLFVNPLFVLQKCLECDSSDVTYIVFYRYIIEMYNIYAYYRLMGYDNQWGLNQHISVSM